MTRIFVLLAFVAGTAFAEAPSDFAYGIPLLPEGNGPFARVPLPAAVYEGVAGPGLADVRVFNAEEAIVPFAFVAPAASTREQKTAIALAMFPLRVAQEVKDVAGLTLSINQTASGPAINLSTKEGQPASGNRLIGYVLDASALDEPITALTFALPEAGQVTTMRLSVEASDDLVGWRTLVSTAPLVNLEYAGRRLTRDRIELAPTKAKYLRITWQPSQPVIGFSAVNAEHGDRVIEAEREWLTVQGKAIAGKDGEYEYDLGGAFPIDRIAVDLAEINSIVPAQLFARATPKDEWRPVTTTVFYRLGEAGGEATNDPVSVNAPPKDASLPWGGPAEGFGSERRYWLLRTDPRAGGAGREPPKLRAGWQPPLLVFAARGSAPFMLAYGKHGATPGALPIATLVPGYDAQKGLPVSVGVAQAQTRTELGGASRLDKPTDTKRWLLWASLVLGAALLGWMAYRLSKQIGVTSAAPPSPPPQNESELAERQSRAD